MRHGNDTYEESLGINSLANSCYPEASVDCHCSEAKATHYLEEGMEPQFQCLLRVWPTSIQTKKPASDPQLMMSFYAPNSSDFLSLLADIHLFLHQSYLLTWSCVLWGYHQVHSFSLACKETDSSFSDSSPHDKLTCECPHAKRTDRCLLIN